MELINNINKTLRDDLTAQIQSGSRLSIAASCFSIYAFQELKEALKDIKELRFIFTSPTFTTEKISKQQREFYIPRLDRERTLYGSEFEVKLRNELTQKAIARECAEWIREKACFKSNKTNEQMMGFINLDETSYSPINGFTTVDLGCERGNNAYTMIQKAEAPFSQAYIDLFNQIWNDSSRLQVVTDEVIDSISNAYKENAPDFLYFVALYNIFNEFLEDISEDELPNEATGFKNSAIWNKLYNFQKDAALAVINKLEKYNGCILADSVGLGKTFSALAVIKYFESRNRTVLVLCPKKLYENWNTYRQNYVNNPLAKDRLNYDILYHTDLSREHGYSNDLDLDRVNWGNYDLVVIDESHNFRNGGKVSTDEKDDLEYRRQQLERLQEDVVDLEEMNSGVSIMDLGLNEFRLDLLEYMNSNHDVEHTPFGLHAVVPASSQAPAGTVFVLKNRTAGVNIDHKNQLHPFYMVYISDDGEVVVDHLHPKDLLDKMRLLCKPMTKPDVKLCAQFNKETRDGLRMGKYSDLLSKAINSIISVKEQSDVDSFLEGFVGELFEEHYVGLDDFELICFLVIKN